LPLAPPPPPRAQRGRKSEPMMAEVVMADDGIAFDGASAERGPLGGAETAFAALAEALVRRGHRVAVRNRCRAPLCHNGVHWAPLSEGIPPACDLYIGSRGHRVIGLVQKARRRLVWLHNPAGYLKKPRNLWRPPPCRPIPITTGAYHPTTGPDWLPRGWARGQTLLRRAGFPCAEP